MKKHPIRLFLLLLAVYLVFALPFRVMTLIPGFTDVRPVTALGPIYGVFFGPVGWFASACGNTIADAIGDALRWSSLAGFAANFFGPCVIWYLWKRYGRHPFALRTCRDLLFHTGTLFCSALLEAAIITPAVACAYPEINVAFFACTVIGNTFLFPIVVGIPLAILMQEELGFEPYVGE